MNDLIQGAGGGGGKGGGGARTPVIASDSLFSKQYARVVDVVSEGEISGLVDGLKSVYLDGTPIQNGDGSYNFSNVTLESRNGTQVQSYIAGFSDVESEISVATQILHASPVVRHVSTAGLDALRVTLGFPQMTFQDLNNGDVKGTSVDILIEIQTAGGGYVTATTDTITGKCTSRYQRAYRVPLTGAGPWDIRVTRVTADSALSNLLDATWFDSYTEIIDVKLGYPNSAVVGIQIDAKQFSSIPSRGFDVKGVKVKIPSNYDPLTWVYSGSWDGTFHTEWTDNPAWIFYDLLTNKRYGCGSRIDAANLDKWALYSIAKYCDELVPDGFGGYERRFTCNLYLQSQAAAYRVISDLASVFRAITYWSAGAIAVIQDAPKNPIALFSPANVVGGTFNYAGTSMRARHTVALVQWNDPSQQYKPAIEYVDDPVGIAQLGVNKTNVIALGCTSRGQARRFGAMLLMAERIENETITFTTGLEAAMIAPGSIIQTTDPNRAGVRYGGRVVTATTTTIQLDAPLTIAVGKSYTLACVLADGSIESSPVTTTPTTTDTLTVSPALSSAPAPMSMWTLTANDLAPESWRVVSVQEQNKTQALVVALAYNPDRFAAVENGIKLQAKATSYLDLKAPTAPTSLAILESLYLASVKAIGVKALLSWRGDAQRYVVQYRRANDNWTEVTPVGTSVEIFNLMEDVYTFKVSGVSSLGKMSPAASMTYTVIGKQALPVDVAGFTYSLTNGQLLLSWANNPDVDLDHYELREGSAWLSSALIAGNLNDPRFIVPPVAAGAHTYRVKAVDTTGHYSLTEATTTVTITAPATPTVTAAIVGDSVTLTWPAVSSNFTVASYEVRMGGASWAAGTSVATVNALTYTRKAQWSGAQRFWVAAADVAGNVGAAGAVDVVVNLPTVLLSSPQVIDNTVLLYWTGYPGTLPIDTYEIRKGATWAGASLIGTKSGLFTSVFETVAATYTYWVAPIDTAGNYGTPASVATAVNQPPDYILKADFFSTFTGTLSNAWKRPTGEILLPINTSQTFATHFTGNSWTSPADQIAAGFPVYIQPSVSTGYYEEVIDYGSLLAASHIQVNVTATRVVHNAAIVTTIATSVDGITYGASTTGTSTFATGFRYVKIRVTVTTDGVGDDLVLLTALEFRLDAKLKNDAGTTAAVSTDTLGTIANFNIKDFVDITAVNASVMGTTAQVAVVDFHDVVDSITYAVVSNVCTVTHTAHPWTSGQNIALAFSSGGGVTGTYTITSTGANTYTCAMTTANTSGSGQSYPQSMRIYMFNVTGGSRVSGNVAWSVKGY